jgi:TIR domain
MDIREMLLAIQQGHKPDQEAILRLRDEGLIEVADVTHLQSPGREYIPTILTVKGLRLLGDGSKGDPAFVSGPSETRQVPPAVGLGEGGRKKRWDVFISHASEDKIEIARPLAEGLRDLGYDVWYDDFSLRLGDSLRGSIDRGLAESRYGVVILSEHFFAKHWPNQELNGLAAIEVGGKAVVLPVWHGVTHADVVQYSPTLADRKAVSTTLGIECVIKAIDAVLNPPIAQDLQDELRHAEENLLEYSCPYCRAPLSTRSFVTLSEHDEGAYEDFECGYAQIDGYKQRPCPSDPKFPKLADYELTYREIKGDTVWRWQCFAHGKTRESQLLSLTAGLGRTQEEALQRVEEAYERCARPWKR